MLCPHGLPGEGGPVAIPAGPPVAAPAPTLPVGSAPPLSASGAPLLSVCGAAPSSVTGSPPLVLTGGPVTPLVPSCPLAGTPYVPPLRPSARTRRPPSLLDPGTERDPHPVYRTLRGSFPLVYDEPFGAWLISGYADVRAALADPRLVAPPPGPAPDRGEGGAPAAYRALAPPEGEGRVPDALAAGIERTAHVLARRLASRREADLVAEFCQWLPAAAAVAALGLPYEDAARVHAWCRTGLDHVGGRRPGLDVFLRPHIVRRRARPGGDLLSAFCVATDDGEPLSDEAVTGLAATVLGAAGDTTARALASFLANLLDHPGQLDLIRVRPELTGGAWAESLRRDPPVQIVPRRALEPIGPIPEGATVACLIGAAGRDPARFADPDRYDAFRADPGELAYGSGRRSCLGAPLARLTAEHGLRALLTVFPELRRADGPRPRAEGLISRSPRTLPVRLR